MDTHGGSGQRPEAVNGLVAQLLDWGGVLSQIIARMVEFEASGKPRPDLAPIPDVAQSLVSGVAIDVTRHYSVRDLSVAAKIVRDVTKAICNDIFSVDPDFISEADLN